MGQLKDRVSIVIKTFIRYGVCRKAIKAFREIAPDLEIIVIDDTPRQWREKLEGVRQIEAGEDIGLCAGRNLGFRTASTPCVLYADDDTIPEGVTLESIEKIVEWIETERADLIGWQGWSMTREGGNIYLDRLPVGEFTPCDLTQNAFIARRETILAHPWPEEIKINGEHFTWFALLRERGVRVAASKLLNFENKRTRNPRYTAYRARSFRGQAKRLVGVRAAIWRKGK